MKHKIFMPLTSSINTSVTVFDGNCEKSCMSGEKVERKKYKQ